MNVKKRMKRTIDAQRVVDDARSQVGVSDAQMERASEDPRFSAEVRARLKVSTANALSNIKVIQERTGERAAQVHVKANALLNSRDPIWIRLRKLYALIDELHSFNGENVACRRGCSHCCHTQVAMAPAEAEMLGRAIGRKPRQNVARNRALGHYDAQPYGYHTPCPFLVDHACSIYEHRPLVCRKLINADIDDLLCHLTAPPGPPVPYLDRVAFDFANVAICTSGSSLPKSADIREYFPRETK